METIIQTKGDWRLCLDDENDRSKILWIDILAWAVRANGAPVPITPFGRADVSIEYMAQGPTGNFIVLPNGPALTSYSDAKAWLVQQRG